MPCGVAIAGDVDADGASDVLCGSNDNSSDSALWCNNGTGYYALAAALLPADL